MYVLSFLHTPPSAKNLSASLLGGQKNIRCLLSSLIFLLGKKSLKAVHRGRVARRKGGGKTRGSLKKSFFKCEDRGRARLEGSGSH